MKAMKMVAAALVAVAMGSVCGLGAAKAIDLRNEDGVAYAVKVTSSAMSRDIEVNALTLSFIVCVGECTFEVAGLGTVSASKNDVVTLAEGKLSVAPAATTAAR